MNHRANVRDDRVLPETPVGRLDSAPHPLFLEGEDSAAVLMRELEAAGVELGAYDRRLVAWLAGWEGSTVLTIASWIRRAASEPEA